MWHAWLSRSWPLRERSRHQPSRPQAHPVFRARAEVWLPCCVGMLACGLDSNFADVGERILNPEVQALDVPGERLLQGVHDNLRIAADSEGTRYLLGLSDQGSLSVLNLTTRTLCNVPGVSDYSDPIGAEGLQPLIPYLGPVTDDPRVLRFATFDCQSVPYEAQGLGLTLSPVAPAGGSGLLGLLATTLPPTVTAGTTPATAPAIELRLIHPWDDSERVLARELRVSPARVGERYVWVDAGTVVVADSALNVETELGGDVTNLIVSPDFETLVLVNRGAGNTVDLYRSSIATAPEVLVTGACPERVGFLTTDAGVRLAALVPCEERTLKLFDTTLGADQEPATVSHGVLEWQPFRRLAGQAALLLSTAPTEPGGTPTAWLWRGGEQQNLGQQPLLRETLAVDGEGGPGSAELLFVTGSAEGVGQLQRWQPDQPLQPVADGVARLRVMRDSRDPALSLVTALTQYDGTSGELVRVLGDGSTQPLASGVAADPPNANAFMSHVEGRSGDLELLDMKRGSSRLVAHNVVRGAFQFTQQFDGLYYLANRDPSTLTNDLQVTLLGHDRQVTVNSGVSEAREVAFPSTGILYNVVSGEQAGVWFAKAL
jgi:hypothetical protein